jgi:putative cardiolipin synthase
VLPFAICLLCLGVFLLWWYSRLPSLKGRVASRVMTETDATTLGRCIAPPLVTHPNLSGIYPLPDPRGAFAARIQLARSAERCLDVQYYIWNNDLTGVLLAQALIDAADRGVRVRVLLDDNNTGGLDSILAAFDAHPRIEVRLFNPFVIRWPRLGYLTDFARANRRMHNKSFTADNQVTIVGGRNIGDEYFGATNGSLFIDLDAMAIGPVVNEVSLQFDRYWNSDSSYPVRKLLRRVNADERTRLAAAAREVENSPRAQAYLRAINELPFVQQLLENRLKCDWAEVHVVSDDPAKGLGRAKELFPKRLQHLIGRPKKNLELASAYFVPTREGAESLISFARDGARVMVLTNSLEATDVPAVHAGYAKRRRQLLAAGIRLFELKHTFEAKGKEKHAGLGGSSGASLHAKTFSVDHARLFIGSFNFDPRSARLNTELGFVIESPRLAREVADVLETRVTKRAYEVHLDTRGELYWTYEVNGELVRYDSEPGTSIWRRAMIQFLTFLPIESLL